MVAVFPDACRLRDDVFGQLPLHIACKFGASEDVLKFIVASFPDALRLTDTAHKRLPLHYSCYDGFPNAVSMLIEADRHALAARDANGKTPEDLCRESLSPLRGAILKRIHPDYDAPSNTKAELKSSRQRHSTGTDVPQEYKESNASIQKLKNKRDSFDLSLVVSPKTSSGDSSGPKRIRKKKPRRKSFDDSYNRSVKKEHLELRKAALIEELRYASENITTERAEAEMRKSKMEALGVQVQAILDIIEKERASLDDALSTIKASEESMTLYEEGIKLLDQELGSLSASSSRKQSLPSD